MGYEFASECFCGAADEDYTIRGTSDACKNGLGGRLAMDVYKVLDDPPVDGKFGQWGPCSKTCGEDGNRVRLCDSPAPQYGGADCVGSASDNCPGNEPCPIVVDGSWGEWGSCSDTCGNLGTRTRLCDSPAAQNGGAECPGMGSDNCPENDPCRQEHVGCFADKPWKGRTLSYFHAKRKIGLLACGKVCRERGSLLMGYEFGQECFCGDASEDYSRHGVADSCKDGLGGRLGIDIYKVLPDPITAAPVTAPKLVQESMGCYADKPWKGRTLSYYHSKHHLSVEECAAICVGRGDKWMGYEFQRECFCGDASEDYTRYGQEDNCENGRGGRLSLNVYRVM